MPSSANHFENQSQWKSRSEWKSDECWRGNFGEIPWKLGIHVLKYEIKVVRHGPSVYFLKVWIWMVGGDIQLSVRFKISLIEFSKNQKIISGTVTYSSLRVNYHCLSLLGSLIVITAWTLEKKSWRIWDRRRYFSWCSKLRNMGCKERWNWWVLWCASHSGTISCCRRNWNIGIVYCTSWNENWRNGNSNSRRNICEFIIEHSLIECLEFTPEIIKTQWDPKFHQN